MTSISCTPAGLQAAVIGVGRMGVRHIQALKNLGLEICGIADAADQALETARKSYELDASVCFTDPLEMLRIVRPQALVIATTAPSHANLVLAAVNLGVRYILCEKPMATSLAESDAMIDACRRAGVLLAINHQMRFMEQYVHIKRLIGSAEFGPLASIVVAGSNFGLAMNVSHYFEMFRFVSDTSVCSVQAWFEEGQVANPRGAEFEDRSGRLLAWGETGTPMYVDFSVNAGHGVQVVYICRHGQIVVDEVSGELRSTARCREFRDLPTTRYCMPADDNQTSVKTSDIVTLTMKVWSGLLGGQTFPDAVAGAHALTCLVAAHISHENSGRNVQLDDPMLPRSRKFSWA